jgi:hypothetical protein
LQGRFQQVIGQELGAALEATAVNLYFADVKSSGVIYDNTLDVVGLQTVDNNATIKLVGELKVLWVVKHDLQAASFCEG